MPVTVEPKVPRVAGAVQTVNLEVMAKIDLAFRLRGSVIAADHGYFLYAALSHRLPRLHGSQAPNAPAEFAIHPISGQTVGERQLRLTPESRLTIRTEPGLISELLPLSGETLNIGGSSVEVLPPEVLPLRPAARLTSRLVIIKGFLEAEGFLQAVQRQLESAQIKAEIRIPQRQSTTSREGRIHREEPSLLRRTMQIRDKQVVGYAIGASGLDAESSLRLQEIGVGGRRHFGCGIFVAERS